MPKENPDKQAERLQYGRGIFGAFSDLAFKDRLEFLRKYKTQREEMNNRWFGVKTSK